VTDPDQRCCRPTHDIQDECRGWDVNELVFSAALWGTYQVRRQAGDAAPSATALCRAALRCSPLRTVVHAPRKPRTVAPARPSSTIHPFEPATPCPQPLMRADFTLFDEYEHMHGDKPPFAFPLTTFWGSRDRRIKQHLVQVRL